MATITGYTADRMKQIEDSTVVGATLVNYDLVLTKRDGTKIPLGSVRGAMGPAGPVGPKGADGNGYLIVTSTTRPTTGNTNGRLIFETDTGRTLAWYNNRWVAQGAGGMIRSPDYYNARRENKGDSPHNGVDFQWERLMMAANLFVTPVPLRIILSANINLFSHNTTAECSFRWRDGLGNVIQNGDHWSGGSRQQLMQGAFSQKENITVSAFKDFSAGSAVGYELQVKVATEGGTSLFIGSDIWANYHPLLA